MEYKLPMAEEKTEKKMKGRKRVGRKEAAQRQRRVDLCSFHPCRSWAPPAGRVSGGREPAERRYC